jgi:hypothetical protein
MIRRHRNRFPQPAGLWLIALVIGLCIMRACIGKAHGGQSPITEPTVITYSAVSPLTLPAPPQSRQQKSAPVIYGPHIPLKGGPAMQASMAAVALTLAPPPTNTWWLSPNLVLMWNASKDAAVTGYQVHDGSATWTTTANSLMESNAAIGMARSVSVCCTTRYGTNSTAAVLPLDTRIGTLTISRTNGWPLLLWPHWPTNNWQVLASPDLATWQPVTPVLTNSAAGLWRFVDVTNRTRQTFYRLRSM